MDFDNAWCPACDRQIQPKRVTVSVPVQQKPKLKPSLVNGTGRSKHVKPQQPPVLLRKRTVIDQGPIPLYCSDECQVADLSATRSGPPLDPARDEPMSSAAPINGSCYSSSETESSDDSFSPATPSSIDKIARLYNFPPLPPLVPAFDDPEVVMPTPEYNSGIMMAGRLISSLCPPPAKPHVGPHPPPVEARKPVPGWTDGSNAWRASVYSFSSRPQNAFYPEFSDKPCASSTASSHPASRVSCSSALRSAQAPPSQRSLSDDMIAKFSQSFQRRSVCRPSPHPSTPTLSSPSETQSVSRSPPRRERTLLPPAIQGKLLVPDVKLKIHSSSSASLSSAWSGPTSASSARSPLSITSDSEEERPSDSASSLPPCRKRPTVESESSLLSLFTCDINISTARSWSYDNFKTYPVMQLPLKKVKQIQKQIINGQVCEVEVEIEMEEERKCLFNFAPSIQVSQ